MDKIWSGRLGGSMDESAEKLNSSIGIDGRMYRQDIEGSIAHATMLGEKGIISAGEAAEIINSLQGILEDINRGALKIDPLSEDIHSFVERTLTERIGESGKKLHTARSRNDQVVTDLRMFLRDETARTITLTKRLLKALLDRAGENKATVMPGYTHLQRAQPVTFGHHLMAYAMMLLRDIGRLDDAARRINVSPLGSCALAGTGYEIDRARTAELLGFDEVALNSMDAVSDRDFCLELLSCHSILMTHLSRLAEELVLWSSWEFRFVELDDKFTTGSSIMPQKKNPDAAELIRGKAGRVYGNLVATLVMLKGLPLAYNKDMQEDKEAVMDSVDTVNICLEVMAPMIMTMTVFDGNMRKAAELGFINATDVADYLVMKGMPFRSAYKVAGEMVSVCVREGKSLEALGIKEYKNACPLFEDDIKGWISIDACVERRTSKGGASAKSVEEQIAYVESIIDL